MQLLKDRIRKDGKVKEGNVLKVRQFSDHKWYQAVRRRKGSAPL